MKKNILILVIIIAFLSFSFLIYKPQKSIIGIWKAKWDDIDISLEFQKNNKGIETYSNPNSSRKFFYEVKNDSLFLFFEKNEKYPKYERRYKFSISKNDELYLVSKNHNGKFVDIAELVTYKRIE